MKEPEYFSLIKSFRPKKADSIFRELMKEFRDHDLGRHRSPYVYRGLPDKTFKLETNLQRIGSTCHEVEYHLLRSFRKYTALKHDLSDASLWKLMAVAQHHGLPTRLLDWTFSPLIALHFATEDLTQYHKDGVVWAVKPESFHCDLPFWADYELKFSNAKIFSTHMLDSMVKHSIHEQQRNSPDFEQLLNPKLDVFRSPDSFESVRDAVKASQASFRHVGSIYTQIKAFDRLQNAKQPKQKHVLFFDPPSIDDRIINQHALFSIATSEKLVMCEHIAQKCPQASIRYIIPANMKWSIRNRLDQYNITERIIYPGFDGLTRYLKRHYGPTISNKSNNKSDINAFSQV